MLIFNLEMAKRPRLQHGTYLSILIDYDYLSTITKRPQENFQSSPSKKNKKESKREKHFNEKKEKQKKLK